MTTAESEMRAVLTPEEAAHYLPVNPQTVYRLLRAGKCPGVKIGRQWRIRRRDLDSCFVTHVAEETGRTSVDTEREKDLVGRGPWEFLPARSQKRPFSGQRRPPGGGRPGPSRRDQRADARGDDHQLKPWGRAALRVHRGGRCVPTVGRPATPAQHATDGPRSACLGARSPWSAARGKAAPPRSRCPSWGPEPIRHSPSNRIVRPPGSEWGHRCPWCSSWANSVTGFRARPGTPADDGRLSSG